MCRKQAGIAIGRLCDKCDGKCPVCDSYVRPTTLVRICDECSFGNYQNKCVVCGGEGISDAFYCFECTRLEKDRDGCPKIINLGSSRTDVSGALLLCVCSTGCLRAANDLYRWGAVILPKENESHDYVLTLMRPGFGPLSSIFGFGVQEYFGRDLELVLHLVLHGAREWVRGFGRVGRGNATLSRGENTPSDDGVRARCPRVTGNTWF